MLRRPDCVCFGRLIEAADRIKIAGITAGRDTDSRLFKMTKSDD